MSPRESYRDEGRKNPGAPKGRGEGAEGRGH